MARLPYLSMNKKKDPISIPVLEESFKRLRQIPDDIKLIQEKEKLGLTQFARTFDVSKSCVWYWRKGIHTPREPLAILCLIFWADKLRNGQGTLKIPGEAI
jgi:hypothetical protein